MIEECLRVAFIIKGDGCPLADASAATEISIEAQSPQLRSDGYALLKFTAQQSKALREQLDADDRISFLHVAETDENDIYRCLSKDPCVVHELVNNGLLVDSIQYQNQQTIVSGAVVDRGVLQKVVNSSQDDIEISLRYLYPLNEGSGSQIDRRWDLTSRQEECLQMAADMGYFSIPRKADASEVANELDISKSAFLERLRRAERQIFESLY